MKRIIALVLACVLLLSVCFGLTGCGRQGICDECGRNKRLTQFTFPDGMTEWMCDDCIFIAKLWTS